MKKMVLKVNIYCNKCKTDVLKAVTKLEGIKSVSVDSDKGTVTVIGDVDPVLVSNRMRKIGKVVEIESVEPHKPDSKPDDEKIDDPKAPLPHSCNDCQLVAVGFGPYNDARFCSIL